MFFRKARLDKTARQVEFPEGYFYMPWTSILEIKRNKDNSSVDQYFFEVSMKDLRVLTFKLSDPLKNQHKKLMDLHRQYNQFKDLYAFKFANKTDMEKKCSGWDQFNLVKEYYRQGLDFQQEEKPEFAVGKNVRWRLIKNQKNSYDVYCESYPEYLMIPGNISPVTLNIAIKFRSKNRFPAMTYYWMHPSIPRGYATLWRSAQCNV